MNYLKNKIIKIISLGFLYFFPLITFAQSGKISDVLKSCDDGSCNFGHLGNLLNAILEGLFLATTSVATIMFVYAGFLYISAQGDTGQIKKAHGLFRTVVIGFVIILVAILLVKELLVKLGVGPGLITIVK